MIKLKTPTPGDHLREILEDLRVSQYRFAKATGIPASGVGAIIAGNRRITPETALRIGKALGTTAEFWMDLQQHYDITTAKKNLRDELAAVEEIYMVTA